jgi:hypothetical protein
MAEDKLSLAETFARLRKRDPSVLSEITKAAILEAWRAGRLQFVASKVREFYHSCRVRPHVWVPEPALGDKAAQRHIKALEKTRIVGFLPKTGEALPTTAPTTEVSEELLSDQPIPAGIPYTDIKFHWPTSSALWYIETGIVFSQLSDIWTLGEAFEQVWPPLAVQSPEQWAFAEVNRLLKDGAIQSGIGRRELARELQSRLDDACARGLVSHTMKVTSIYNALAKEKWGLWPVR